MSGTCVDCQTFLAVGETRYCGACFPVKAQRCRGCRIQFEPDGDMFCKACRATPFLWEPT